MTKDNWFRRLLSKIRNFRRKSPSQLINIGTGGFAKEMETLDDGTTIDKSFELQEFSIVDMPEDLTQEEYDKKYGSE